MHRSSELIGAIAAALAKAQIELTNPQKSLVATLEANGHRQGPRSFRYASLADGLEIVRKSLGAHEIAVVQTTAIARERGQVSLETLLAHSSGEWIASEWPVCSVADMAAPKRMGAALTYARRYALFSMVGIAGEDDLDAPDQDLPAGDASGDRLPPPVGRRGNGSLNKPADLAVRQSPAMREQLIAEIAVVTDADALALWAHKRFADKNALEASDAKAVELAYADRLRVLGEEGEGCQKSDSDSAADSANGSQGDGRAEVQLRQPVRRRDKAHLKFVAAQPCLVCQKSPCDPHHVKFAQPRAMGRKVSDEFTVPLCREHHRALHRFGNERAFWAEQQIKPLEVATELWGKSSAASDRLTSALTAASDDTVNAELR